MIFKTPEQSLLFQLSFLNRLIFGYIWTLIIFSIVGLLLGTTLWWLLKPPTVVTGSIQIGRVGAIVPAIEFRNGEIFQRGNLNYFGLEPGYKLISDVNDLIVTISTDFEYRPISTLHSPLPHIWRLNTFPGHMLEIHVVGKSELEAQSYLDSIVQSTLSQHQESFDQQIYTLKALKQFLTDRFTDFVPYDIWIETPGSDSRSRKTLSFQDSVELLYGIKRALAESNSYPTTSGPRIVEHPTSLITVFMLIGVASGISIGVFSILLLPAIKNVRVRRQAKLKT